MMLQIDGEVVAYCTLPISGRMTSFGNRVRSDALESTDQIARAPDILMSDGTEDT